MLDSCTFVLGIPDSKCTVELPINTNNFGIGGCWIFIA